jgi:catechol 2,3-dioxygenase-like lactoylglutathione lyase family enzyme
MTDCPVTGLPVVLLLARDTDRTAAFYRDVLGIPLRGEEHDGRHRHYGASFAGSYFTIQPSADLHAPEGNGGYDYLQLCFSVPDLDAFMKSLAGAGVTPLHPPAPFEHTTFTTLLDPDGRHVRVMTPWA